MTEETKVNIKFHISLLKEAMKQNGVVFTILADKEDINNSKLCFIDKDRYFEAGKLDGITVSLTELNKGLV